MFFVPGKSTTEKQTQRPPAPCLLFFSIYTMPLRIFCGAGECLPEIPPPQWGTYKAAGDKRIGGRWREHPVRFVFRGHPLHGKMGFCYFSMRNTKSLYVFQIVWFSILYIALNKMSSRILLFVWCVIPPRTELLRNNHRTSNCYGIDKQFVWSYN